MVVVRRARGKKSFKDGKDLNDNWGKAVERNMDRKVEVDRASEQVDVGRLKQDGLGVGNPSLQWEEAGGAGRQ
jgi:hypothetical protein